MLLFIVDTLRADALSPYGAGPEATPHIATFAQQSAVFERAYAPSTWTRASVASILSALQPEVHGALDRGDPLSDRVLLLSEVLRDQGYRTGFITTNPNTSRFFGFDQGFDEFVELYDHQPGSRIRPATMKASAEDVARHVLRFIEAGEEPFLLVVLSIDPHSPYAPPSRFDPGAGEQASEARGDGAWINRSDLSEADQARIRSLYQGEVAYADHGFGHVMKSLRRMGLGDRTITVLTSDHGEAFWEHGFRGHGKSLYDETLRVPLIVRYPAKVAPGRIEASAQIIDIAPTLLALAQLSAPEPIGGRSLFDPAAQTPPSIHARLKLEDRDMASVRTGHWKLVWDFASDTRKLYDVREPGEREDLAATAPTRVEAMSRELEAHLAEAEAQRDALIGDAPASAVVPEDLPAEQRRLLIELGYLEPEADASE